MLSALEGADDDHRLGLPYFPQAERALVLTLHRFVAELKALPGRVSDPGLGAIRLQWWREALAEVFGSGGVRHHPLVEALAATARDRAEVRPLMEAMIDATGTQLHAAPITSVEEAVTSFLPFDGRRLALVAHALWGEAPSEDVPRLGAFHGAYAALCRTAIGAGRGPLPACLTPMDRVRLCADPQGLAEALRADAKPLWRRIAPIAPKQAPLLAPLKLLLAGKGYQRPGGLIARLQVFTVVARGR